MNKTIMFLVLALCFTLLAGTAWAVVPPPSVDDFENANLGDLRHQTSGSGWANDNNNYWNGPDSTDGRNLIQVVSGGPTGNYVKSTCLDTKEINRNFNENLWAGPMIYAGFDFMIGGGTLGNDFNLYISAGGGNNVHFEFRSNGEIRHRAATNTVLGYWNGTDADPNLNLLNQWKTVLVNVDMDNQVFSLNIGGTEFSGLAFRTPGTSLDHIRFYGGKVSSLDGTNYWALDNVWLNNQPVPEPSSILALAGGLLGTSGLIWRRRR